MARKDWKYEDSRYSLHGTMRCNSCGKAIEGEYRVRNGRNGFVVIHRACSLDDANWAKLDQQKAERAAEYAKPSNVLADLLDAYEGVFGNPYCQLDVDEEMVARARAALAKICAPRQQDKRGAGGTPDAYPVRLLNESDASLAERVDSWHVRNDRVAPQQAGDGLTDALDLDSRICEHCGNGNAVLTFEDGRFDSNCDDCCADTDYFLVERLNQLIAAPRQPGEVGTGVRCTHCGGAKIEESPMTTGACECKMPCPRCNGSGWIIRDPDIGTDQECPVCDGAGLVASAQQDEREVGMSFEEWLCSEMPAGTVIGDPKWWAPRILRAAQQVQADDPIRAVVQAAVDLMEAREWAEHFAECHAPGDELALRLESCITNLHNEAYGGEERVQADAGSVAEGEIGVLVDCYTLSVDVSKDRFASPVRIQRARQMEGPDKWKVERDGSVLNKSGDWEYEPLPSSRSDEFLARCRYDTAQEAIRAAMFREQNTEAGK